MHIRLHATGPDLAGERPRPQHLAPYGPCMRQCTLQISYNYDDDDDDDDYTAVICCYIISLSDCYCHANGFEWL